MPKVAVSITVEADSTTVGFGSVKRERRDFQLNCEWVEKGGLKRPI